MTGPGVTGGPGGPGLTGTSPGGKPSDTPAASGFVPAPAGLRRLTLAQYGNAIHDLLGSTVTIPGNLEPDDQKSTFSNVGAYQATLSQNGFEKFRLAAFDMAGQAFGNATAAQALVGCKPAAAADPCIDTFLKGFGRRAFRRPLSAGELGRYKMVVTDAAAEQGNVMAGVQFAVAGLLQSSNFLYVAEIGEGDPQDRSRLRFTGYEMATRLSFTLWNTTPDGPLLDAAEQGQLTTQEGVRAQAERLLGSDRARAAVTTFFAESLGYDGLGEVSKDKTAYPSFDTKLLPSMQGELDRLIGDYALRPDANVLDMFDSKQSYVDKTLASFYGISTMPAGATGFVKLDLPAERVGLLTTGGVMMTHAQTNRTSPTQRGKFIRERVLCQQVPNPPNDVDTSALNKKPATGPAPRTMREKLASHAAGSGRPDCAACHGFIDPIGLALENYDGIGKYRTTENGATLDVSGDIDGTHFNGPKDLIGILKASPLTAACLVRELYRASTGHVESDGEKVVLDGLGKRFTGGGAHFRALLVDLVGSDGFRYAVKPN